MRRCQPYLMISKESLEVVILVSLLRKFVLELGVLRNKLLDGGVGGGDGLGVLERRVVRSKRSAA